MAGGVGHTGGLTNPTLGAEDAEPIILILVGLPCLKRGCLNKKPLDVFLSILQIEMNQRKFFVISKTPSGIELCLHRDLYG